MFRSANQLVGIAVFLSYNTSLCHQHLTSKEDNAKAFAIIQRLRNGMDPKNLRIRPGTKEKDEMHVHTLWKDSGYLFSKEGLPVARVASCVINSDISTIAERYSDIKDRKNWDKTANETYSVVSKDDGMTYNYFRGKSGWLVPARDFVYTQVELPSAVVSIADIQAKVIFNRDGHDKLPKGSAVRGEQNSLLILRPAPMSRSSPGPQTQATLLVECDPKGWARVFGTSTMDWLAGDCTVQSLKYLKESIEADMSDDAQMSVEEAARMKFMKKQRQRNDLGSSTIAEELSPADREDLIITAQMLQKRLEKIALDEKETNVDLSELRARVQSDLAKVKSRL